jgi:hypothetical protein
VGVKPRSAAQRKASVANARKARAAKAARAALPVEFATELLPSDRFAPAAGADLTQLARLVVAVWRAM